MKFEVNSGAYIYATEDGVDGYYLWHDGTLHWNNACKNSHNKYEEGWWKTKQEAEKFLKSWLPPSDWISKEDVKYSANYSDYAALVTSITHWKQIVLAGPEGFTEERRNGYVNTNQSHCSLCQRYGGKDISCPLKGEKCDGYGCVTEYGNAIRDLDGDKIDGAVLLLNKLISIYNDAYVKPHYINSFAGSAVGYTVGVGMFNTSGQYNVCVIGEKMSSVDDRLIQVDTDIKALEVEKQKLLAEKKKSEKYIFQPGDVVENNMGGRRIIINFNAERYSFSLDGRHQATGQKEFEDWGYKKIGVISDFLKKIL